MCVVLGTWVLSVIATLLIAAFLTGLGRTMSWYARPLWIFFIYVIPIMLVSMATVLVHSKRYQTVSSVFLTVS